MYSYQPQISAASKRALKAWLLTTLQNPTMSNDATCPLLALGPSGSSTLTLWMAENRPVQVMHGAWEVNEVGNYVALARPREPHQARSPSTATRLSVLTGLFPFIGETADENLVAAVADTITKVILGQYKELTNNLVVTAGAQQATRIALNPTGVQVAAFVGETWVLPTGEPVEVVEGQGWTICAL